MKYLIVLLFLSFGATADTINLIVSGKAGGTFHTRSMMMYDYLTHQGHDVELINAGDHAKSKHALINSDTPTIMPWMDSANVKTLIEANPDTFGILDYVSPIAFCSTKYKYFQPDEIVIGYSASWPNKIFKSLAYTIDKTVRSIPFKNSGQLVLAFQTNDLDYIAVSLSKVKKLPTGSCFAVTGHLPIDDMQPLKNALPDYDYRFISQHAFWFAVNFDNQTAIRQLLLDAIHSGEYSAWVDKSKFIAPVSIDNIDDQLASVLIGVDNWSK